MEEYSLEESDNSDYSEEYDDPPTTVNIPTPEIKESQENILHNKDDLQSRHELHRELY